MKMLNENRISLLIRGGVNLKNSRSGTRRKNIEYTVLALPAVIVLLLFKYVPMPGIVLAFKNYNFRDGIFGSPSVGLANFKFVFSTKESLTALVNTLFYNSIFIVTTIVGSVVIAILLNEVMSQRALKLYQTSMFLPYFLSWTIVAYIAFALLDTRNGLFNSILIFFGNDPIRWYQEPKYWRVIHIVAHFWKSIGYATLLNYARIISIDQGYYEAASIDGATRFQMALHITIPQLVPIILINFLNAVGRIFNADFGQFWLLPMESGRLKAVSSVLDTYVYQALLGSADIGMGAAAGLFQSISGFALVVLVNIFIRKYFGKESAMF